MRIFRQAFTLLALCAAAVLPAQAQNGTISGRAFDAEDGRPVGSARVSVVTGGRLTASGVSGTDGAFTIPGVAAGTYDVVVTAIGLSRKTVKGVVVRAGATTTVELGMTAFKTNIGTVTVTSGRKPEKTMDAPAQITSISSEEIRARPAVTIADNLKSVPGLDISTGGIVQSNIVSRGFNNAFSGSMLMLQDYRFAGVPSLRVNVPFLFTGTNEDIERIEVLNGPASALYGPNSGSGAIHIITRSPFNSQGATISIDGGERSIYRIGLRGAQAFGSKIAIKASGEYMQGKDFQFADPAEPGTFPVGSPAGRVGTPNVRNYDVGRMTGEARMDIRPMDDMELITTFGFTKVDKGMELTGANGTSQIKNWTYQNLQQRFRWGRLFAQAFVNTSNAGNANATDLTGTFLLRSGQPIADQSSVMSAQIQHGFAKGDLDFTYGADLIKTTPETKNTINGRNEERDNVTEYGAYLQGSWKPSREWEFLAAARGDHHSALDSYFFSPRAAVLYKPTANETWRLTYNRAFNTPANFTFFLDLIQSRNLGGSGYDLRAVGNAQGWKFDKSCSTGTQFGAFCMRTPFNGNAAKVPVSAAASFPGLITAQSGALTAGLAGAVTQALTAAGIPAGIIATVAPLIAADGINGLRTGNGTPATDAQIAARVAFISAGTVNLSANALNDIDPLKSTYNETYELGWKGTFGRRFSLDFSGWTQLRRDVGSSAGLSTPSVFFGNPTALGGYIGATTGAALGPSIVTRLIAAGIPAGTASAVASAITASVAGGFAGAVTPSLARAPLGTVIFNDATFGANPDLIATYSTVPGRIWIYGADAAFQYLVDDHFTLSGTLGGINRNVFTEYKESSGLPIMSNSPKLRSTLTLRYQQEPEAGFGAEVRGRYSDAFQVNSGVYNTGYCNVIAPGNTGAQANAVAGLPSTFPGGVCPAGTFRYNEEFGSQVPVNLMFDLGMTYRFDIAGKRALFSLTVNNALDNKVPTFAGVPNIGRVAMTRLSYTF